MGILDKLFKPNVEKMKAKKDVKGLIKALRYEDRDVRRAAVYALEEIGDARAVEGLRQALRHEDVGLRMYVAEALQKIKLKET